MTIQLPDNEADVFALIRKELFSSFIGGAVHISGPALLDEPAVAA